MIACVKYNYYFWIIVFLLPFNIYLGETAKAALKEICSLEDFSIISLKHIQLLGITIPGQEVHKPKTNPDNNKNKVFIWNTIKAL